MPGKIFISYRRDDDPAFAARVRDGLAAKFGHTAIFMDVDNLLAGQRFDDELAKALQQCDVLIAVMGARWMDVLAAKTAAGEHDYVVEEIGAALKRRIVVIPARVGRESTLAPLPCADDLPEAIRELVRHQKHDVVHEKFGRDVAELAAVVAVVRRSKAPPRPWGKVAAVAAVTLLLGGGVTANQLGWLYWPADLATAQKTAAEAAAKAKAEDADRKRLGDAAAQVKSEQEARQKAHAAVSAAQLQRGFTVYREACAACHSLAGFPSVYANEAQARAANNGALPRQILIESKSDIDGLFGFLTGYSKVPAGFRLRDGMSYNTHVATKQTAMFPPLTDNQIAYKDGTPTTVDQYAKDVTAFITSTINPNLLK